MVTTRRRPTAEIGVKHARAGFPSRWIVQAPHKPIPHPYFVPVNPKVSRRIHSSGVFGSTSAESSRPLMVMVTFDTSFRPPGVKIGSPEQLSVAKEFVSALSRYSLVPNRNPLQRCRGG